MDIVGVQKTTLVDFPGKIAMTLFTLGCNMRCPYCHNKQISFDFADKSTMDEEQVLSSIRARKSFIDGVVISGGEPTLQRDLLTFLHKIKKEGLLVKLDTNGTNPDVVQSALREGLVDYVALDIKTSFQRYSEYLGTDGFKVLRTYNIIKDSSVAYELRMTCYPEFITGEILQEIIPFLRAEDRVFIQQCNPAYFEKDEVSYPEFVPYQEKQLTLFGEMLTSNGIQSTAVRGLA